MRYLDPRTSAALGLISGLLRIGEILALDEFMREVRRLGLPSRLDGLYVGGWSVSALSLINLVNPGAYTLVPANETAIAGRHEAAGFQGNGTDVQYATGFNVSSASGKKFAQNDACEFVYCLASQGRSNRADIGLTGSDSPTYLNAHSSTAGAITHRGNRTGGSATVTTTSNTSGERFVAWNRTGASVEQVILNGAVIASPNTTSSSLPDGEILFMGHEPAALDNSYNLDIAVGFGGSLTEAQWRGLYNALRKLVQFLCKPRLFTQSTVYFNDGVEPIIAHTYRPANYHPKSDLLLTLHGVGRNATGELRATVMLADRYGMLAVCPHFESTRFPNRRYGEAGIHDSGGNVQATNLWTFEILERIVNEVRRRERRPDMGLRVTGHSAGGGLAARMAAFKRLGAKRFIGGNAGTAMTPWDDYKYPYGMQDLTSYLNDNDFMAAWAAAPYCIYIGELDNVVDGATPGAPGAVAQGETRYDRAYFNWNFMKDLAQANSWPFNWEIVEAPGIGHSATGLYHRPQSEIALFGPLGFQGWD